MSLINQVLTDLEKRGAITRTDGVPVRPVHVPERRRKVIIPALIALILAGMAGLWAGLRDKPTPPPTSAYPGMPNENAPQLPVARLPAIPDHAKPDEFGLNPASKQPASDKHADLRMSLELNSVPLPSSLRGGQTVQTAAEQVIAPPHSIETVKPAASVAGQTSQQLIAATAGPVVPVQGSAPPAENSASGIDKKVRQTTVKQQAENEFRKANGLMQQGRSVEAIAGFSSALQLDAGHEAARQALVGLLLESKRNDDAEHALKKGLDHNPEQIRFAMLLARLQAERNALAQALETLQITLPHAEKQADFQAFIAAILQRLDRHKEAIDHYQIALRLSPNSGVWLMGLGISLQAEKRNEAARTAYRQAVESHSLNKELQAFIAQRLRDLSP